MGSFYFNKNASVLQQLFDKIANLGHATDESSGLMSSDDKAKLDGIEVGAQVNDTKVGVISQTQTWSQANFTDYTMSNIVRGPIPKSSIDLFGAAGAVFNEATGYFELNGLTDLSYEEMLVVYRLPRTNFQYGGLNRLYANQLGRTNFAILAHAFYGSLDGGNAQSFCLNNQYMEAVALNIDNNSGRGGDMRIDQLSHAFYYCRRLKRIIGEIYCSLTPSLQDFSNTFGYCSALEEVRLLRLAKNISFADSPNLSKESLICMIENEASGGVHITITLHPTVYAMAMADDDIGHLREEHQDVLLASA